MINIFQLTVCYGKCTEDWSTKNDEGKWWGIFVDADNEELRSGDR